MPSSLPDWPELSYPTWQPTCTTLHLWSQIVGKVRTAKTPWLNHSWHVTLYVTPRGLATSAIPDGARNFEILFDFVAHQLRIETSDGAQRAVPLQPQSVADFHAKVLANLRELGIDVAFHGVPNELPDATPFVEDRAPREYVPEQAARFWRVLTQTDRVFKVFRSGFLGKSSPVHFFWGSFDLAVTRFSGRRAPARPGADAITREAYSHEVISHGFWPGSGIIQEPAFYAYAAPEPEGFPRAAVRPAAARYVPELGEFVLPYEAARRAVSPAGDLTAFLESTYDAAAELGGWDREALERRPA